MPKSRVMWHAKWRWRRVTQLMARDGMNCTICGGEISRRVRDEYDPNYITFDHIVPRAEGGSDLLSNLRLAHQACNNLRGCDPITVQEEFKRLDADE